MRVLHVMHCDPPTYPPVTPPPTVSHMIIIHIHCSPTERRKYGKIEERNAHVRETTTHNCRPRVALVLAAGVSRFINVTVHSRIVFLSFRSKVFFFTCTSNVLLLNMCVFFDRPCAGKTVSQRIIMQQKEENGKITKPLLYYHSHKRQQENKKRKQQTSHLCSIIFPPVCSNESEEKLCWVVGEGRVPPGHGVDLLSVCGICCVLGKQSKAAAR